MSWSDDVRGLVAELKSNPGCVCLDAEVGEPVTDAEVAEVRARLGFDLDPRFLDYFRQCNGVRLRWGQTPFANPGDAPQAVFQRHLDERFDCGSINVPPLRDLFPAEMDYRFGRKDAFTPNVTTTPFLGGWCVDTLRDRLRPLDDYLRRPDDSSFYNVALVADARFPDPVCLLTEDYAAALTDHAPMRARAYLDLVVATCGLVRARGEVMKSGRSELIERVAAPAASPVEFLRFVLDQLSLERYREISAAWERAIA